MDEKNIFGFFRGAGKVLRLWKLLLFNFRSFLFMSTCLLAAGGTKKFEEIFCAVHFVNGSLLLWTVGGR